MTTRHPSSDSFCVLLSIYSKDDPEHFREAIESVISQSLPPKEIVLTVDGPIPDRLEAVISAYSACFPFREVRLPENKGLGIARGQGILACNAPYVALMDADDLCCPGRFEKQLQYLSDHPGVDVLGGQILEFTDTPDHPSSAREVPTSSDALRRFMRVRNGVNHVTVMFSLRSILSIGGYQSFPGFEDYHLWIRALQAGLKIENLPETLALVRTGNAMLNRRGGLSYISMEFRFQIFMFRSGFIPLSTAAFNFIARAVVRLMPVRLRGLFYARILRKGAT